MAEVQAYAGFAREAQAAADRLELGDGRAGLRVRQCIGAARRDQGRRALADDVVVLAVHPRDAAGAGDLAERGEQLPVGDLGEALGVRVERGELERGSAGADEIRDRLQRAHRGDRRPQRDVDVRLALHLRHLLIEVRDGQDLAIRVVGHVDDRGDPARCCGARAGRDALFERALGVDVDVDDPGEDQRVRSPHDLASGELRIGVGDGRDPPVLDRDRDVLERSADDRAPDNTEIEHVRILMRTMAYDNRSARPFEAQRAPSFVSRLAASACELQLDDLPADALAHGAAMLADTIAVMVAGARQPEVRAFAGHADPLFPAVPAGPCSLLTPEAQRSDAITAAFVNGTAGTFLELDSGIRPTGHPAVHVVPAALAAAQALRKPGDALLIATISGYEVAARLFRAYRLRFPMHPHGHLGAVGAAVAVARLTGRNPAAAADMAASLSLLTVWTPCFEGATVRNTYSGMAATIGLLANKLAASGFTGSAGAQEVAFGELVGERADDADDLLDVDPRRLLLMDDYMKVYSACALSHTTIEAALDLGPLAVDEIERVEVETTANNLKLDRAATANSLSTRFSLPYAAAAAIVHGHANADAFEPDERVFALAARVDVRANAAFDREWPQASPAQVTAYVAGGTRTARVANPRGYPARTLGPEAIRAKFQALTAPSNGGERRYDFDRLLAIETVADSAAIFDPSA